MNDCMDSFDYYIETESFHCKFAKGKPAVNGSEFHEYDEIVMFLGGNVNFASKEIQTALQPRDVVWISKEQFHQFTVSKTEPYTRCIVAIKGSSPLASVMRETVSGVSISRQSETESNLFNKIINTITGSLSRCEQAILLGALITQLVFERKQYGETSTETASAPSSLVSRAISYIDDRFDQNLTVSKIACALYVSESNLSHRFREQLNMSVYRYLTEKRLSVVRQYVSSGYSIGHAAILCGFKDYGSFYRICKSHYGVSPSEFLRTQAANLQITD